MRQALGKGIGALIPSAPPRTSAAAPPAARPATPPSFDANATPGPSVRAISLDAIAVNPWQPRDAFEESALADLARSIATHGVLQPILVRDLGAGAFELIAGERRVRAARLAGLTEIPALVKDAEERDRLVLAIVENIQRADLSPLEEARAYRKLLEDFSLTQEEVANRVGKSRPAVANTLRLLSLPEDVQLDIAAGRLSAGHARALLALEGDEARRALSREIVVRKLSVRDAESMAARAKDKPPPNGPPADPDVRRLADDLGRALGTKVTIHPARGGAGRIEIAFYSDDDLARVADLLAAAGRGASRGPRPSR
jgi:ParB family chromosome partitioning protein